MRTKIELSLAVVLMLAAAGAHGSVVDYTGATNASGFLQTVGGGTVSGSPSPILSDSLTINGHTESGIGGADDSVILQDGVKFEVTALAANGTALLGRTA